MREKVRPGPGESQLVGGLWGAPEGQLPEEKSRARDPDFQIFSRSARALRAPKRVISKPFFEKF